jgi:hypothetical protein
MIKNSIPTMKTRILFAALALLIAPQLTSAQGQQNGMVPGQIQAVKVDGAVWQLLGSSGQRERLNAGDALRQGSVVETAADGSAILLFDNGSTMNLRPSTKFSIDEFLRDPFEAQKMDYKNLEDEPTRSVTKVKVQDGTILFDIPKLKGGSECEIRNPVGAAGIRGTAGFVAPDSVGVTEGSVEVQTQTGQTQTLGAGQSTGITPQGNFGPPPANANQNMQDAQNNSQNLPQNIPPDAFTGASQAQSDAQSALTPAQQESIEQAAEQGQEALVQAVEQIASTTPEAAAAAAAAAAYLMPDAAQQIAAAVAAVAPAQAAAIAAAVAAVAPAQAAAIAAAVAAAAPAQAAAIQTAVTQAVPDQASAIASAVAASGGNNNTTTTGLGNNTQNTTQNPANLSPEQSTPTPTPTPTPPSLSS